MCMARERGVFMFFCQNVFGRYFAVAGPFVLWSEALRGRVMGREKIHAVLFC